MVQWEYLQETAFSSSCLSQLRYKLIFLHWHSTAAKPEKWCNCNFSLKTVIYMDLKVVSVKITQFNENLRKPRQGKLVKEEFSSTISFSRELLRWGNWSCPCSLLRAFRTQAEERAHSKRENPAVGCNTSTMLLKRKLLQLRDFQNSHKHPLLSLGFIFPKVIIIGVLLDWNFLRKYILCKRAS